MSNHPVNREETQFVTEQVVNKLLAKLSSLPFAKPVDSDMVGDWLAIFRREEITQSELAEAYLRIIGRAKEWVPLASIVEECRNVRLERRAYELPLPPPTGTSITPEERDAILKGLKNPAFALEVIEGRGERHRYRIERDDDVLISDEDIVRRDEQVRRLRGEA